MKSSKVDGLGYSSDEGSIGKALKDQIRDKSPWGKSRGEM